MARRQRPTAAAASALPPALASRINKAFDEAINGPSRGAEAAPAIKKKSRKMVIPDDEEEDEEPVASTSASHDADGGIEPGGWELDGNGAGQEYGAGGFLLDNDAAMPSGGGGGFFPEDDGLGGGGGFLLDDNGPTNYSGAGGFVPDFDAPLAGGGFLMEDDMAGGGGFLPDLPELPELPPLPELPSLGNEDLPTPRPPSRIPLKTIPAALDALSLPSTSHDLISLFREVASEDEDGVASVRREAFLEACGVLLGDADAESDDGKPSSNDSEEDAYVEQSGSGRRRIPTRRSTRANPIQDDSVPAAMDLDDPDSEPYDSEDSDIEIVGPSSSKKGKGKATATKTKDKTPARRKKARVLSKAELQEAEDTFELFFEGGLQIGKTKDKVIGLAELERVTRVLNEKISEDEMREMLEYANRDSAVGVGGVVDFTAFTKVLAEAL